MRDHGAGASVRASQLMDQAASPGQPAIARDRWTLPAGRHNGEPSVDPAGVAVLEQVPTQLVPRVASSQRWVRRASVPVRVGVDIAMLALASALALATDSGRPLLVSLVFVFDAAVLASLVSRRGYDPRKPLDVLEDVKRSIYATSLATLVTTTVAAVLTPDDVAFVDYLRLWLFATIAVSVGRIAVTRASLAARRNGLLGAPTLVVGAGIVGRLTAKRLLDHPELGFRPVGFLDKDPLESTTSPLPVPILGASWDLERVAAERGVECVVFSFSSAPHDVMLSMFDECDRLGIRSLVVPRLFERVPSRLDVTHVGGLPLLETLAVDPKSFQYAVKYALDRLISAVTLVVLAPLFLAISAAVLVSLGRPVLYRQDRIGLDGRRFKMLKFRSMRPAPADDEHAPAFDGRQAPGGVEGADRRTRVGSFLRRTSLDELAQLINVAKGEMSLVGPRPERPEFVEYFGENVRRYTARHRVKSGITGWAQVNRLRGRTSISDRVEWDNYYIENFSLWLDLKIVLLTIPEVFRARAE